MSAPKTENSQPVVGDLQKKGAGKEKDNSSSEHPERPPSAEDVKCAICLSDIVNRSYSNSCVHKFCFTCLLEWSKIKPECPLCKSSFRSIYHNFRTNTDYDEYVVPTPPVPHLSIRLTATGGNYRLSPDIMMVREGEFATYGLDLSMMRDAFRDRRYIRVLEARGGHQHTPMNSHHNHGYDGLSLPVPWHPPPFLLATNPFSTSARPEYFGDLILDPRRHEEVLQMPGYQNRRRRYDRTEYVQPFGSTLQPGSVIFPSVEYIRSHPSAVTRLRSWLYRELNVLLGLQRTREQMGFLYDLIMHLINHYDVRSREFRDMVNSYFVTRTAHFQHELYHFMLSGMGMEEYDRTAEYSSASSRRNAAINAVPEVITLDSDDETSSRRELRERMNSIQQRPYDADDIILVESSSSEDEGERNANCETSSQSTTGVSLRPATPDPRIQPVLLAQRGSMSSFPAHSGLNPPDTVNGSNSRLQSLADLMNREPNYSGAVNLDPEMPRLEREVFPLISFGESGLYNNGDSMTANESRASVVTTPVLSSRSYQNTSNDRAQSTVINSSVFNNSSSSSPVSCPMPQRSAHSADNSQRSDRFRLMNAEFDLDMNISVGAYSSPPPEPMRPLSSPDFPILTLRRCFQERDRERSNWEIPQDAFPRDANNGRSMQPAAEEPAHANSLRYSSDNAPGSAFVQVQPSSTEMEELRRPPRPSCIQTNSFQSGYRPRPVSPSPAFRIDLFPHGMSNAQVMDLSRSAGLIPTRRTDATSGPSTSERVTRAHPQVPSLSSGHHFVLSESSAPVVGTSYGSTAISKRKTKPKLNVESPDSGELECLGSFPIQKKPPLAVITLSSDDEEESKVKSEMNELPNLPSSGDETDHLLDIFVERMEMPTDIMDFNVISPEDIGEVSVQSPPLVETFTSTSSSSSSFCTILQPPIINLTAEPSTSSSLKFQISKNDRTRFDVCTEATNRKHESPKDAPRKRPKKHKHSKHESKRKRLTGVSSSDSSDADDASESKSWSPIRSASNCKKDQSKYRSTAIVPKKRKVVQIPPEKSSTPHVMNSSSDESDSSDEDSDIAGTERISNRRHSTSPKKKHKSKSKRSKKSKKSKDRNKEKDKGRKLGSSNCSSRVKEKESPNGSGASSLTCGSSTSVSKYTRRSKRREDAQTNRTVQPCSSSASTFLTLPVSEFDDHPSGLLDLSFNNKTQTPLLPLVDNDDETTIDFRIPQPTAPLSSSSTVDPSAIFGSPSRAIFHAWWDDFSSSERRSWND